ncbi:MAG TPA: Na+/H+ antiporter [Thermoanaerobaculia bacterium]
MHGVQSLQIVFLLLLFFAIAFAALARRLKTPYPIILVLAGLLLSFAPAIPKIALDPDVVFYVFLPPLLYAAAWNTSWREFSKNLTSILMLAIGLVGFTVFGVALASQAWFSAFDWRSGIVLGAVVSTTDAIAATSIATRLGVRRRIVDVLEGESLVNDATGLLALEFGLAMFLGGPTLGLADGIARLAYLSIAGIAIGLIVGVVVDWFERRIDDGPIEIAISILVAYASYFAAEAADASGVLAVVTAGLYLSRRSVHFFSPGVRLQAAAVWDALTFVLNGVVFLLIGLQLPEVLAGIRQHDIGTLIATAAPFVALVIGLRLVWVFPGAYIAYFVRTRLLRHDERPPSLRGIFVIGWAGMRGVIALAAAMSLPATMPNRSLIVFLTFSVILVTLVGQGLTLPPLIRALRLQSSEEVDPEEFAARRSILEEALRHLEQIRERDAERFADVYDDVAQHYQARLSALTGEGWDEHGTTAEHAARYQEVTREILAHEREVAAGLRNSGRISDEVLRRILLELDLSETGMSSRA